MARSKVVTINDKKITIKELRIIELKNDVLPKLTGLTNFDEGTEVKDLLSVVTSKISEFFPDITPEDVENSFPSEIEELIQAFIDVNFHGLKKILPVLFSLLKTGTRTQQ